MRFSLSLSCFFKGISTMFPQDQKKVGGDAQRASIRILRNVHFREIRHFRQKMQKDHRRLQHSRSLLPSVRVENRRLEMVPILLCLTNYPLIHPSLRPSAYLSVGTSVCPSTRPSNSIHVTIRFCKILPLPD